MSMKLIRKIGLTFAMANMILIPAVKADILFYYSAAILPSIIASQQHDVSLAFCGQDNGTELWKSDGTVDGTFEVKDINDGDAGSYPEFLTTMNKTLYFSATIAVGGKELWKSDGTEAGTVKVKAGLLNVQHLTVSSGTLFFRASEGGGDELFKSDGTDAGTVMVANIDTSGGSNPNRLTDVEGILFFAADHNDYGNELWKSDGTENGTVLVKDINKPGPDSTAGSSPDELVNSNGTLFFTANTKADGRELWKSDGTEAGTVLVKNINESGDSNATELTNVNGTVFFSADDGIAGRELWKSDGSEAGTVMVKDLVSGSANPHDLQTVNGLLYFKTNDNNSNEKLWKSDGSEAGTVMLQSGCTL